MITWRLILISIPVYPSVFTPSQGIISAMTKMTVIKKYYLLAYETRETPRTSFSSRPGKRVVWQSWRKHRERPAITIIIFCWMFRGEKKTWKSKRDKNNNYCQYKLQHGSMLRISAGCFHSGTWGGKKAIQAAPLPHGSETILAVFSSVTQQPAFPPFYSATLQTGVNLVIYHSYPRVWLHCDQSYRWIIARPFDRDASLCRHWCERKENTKKQACWWIVCPNQVKNLYPWGSICFSAFPWLFKQISYLKEFIQ